MAGTDKKRVTIYDIAREAGVSSATVSRVLSNQPTVRSKNREKVLALVEKYQFRPNALARGLAEAHSNIIGIIVADVHNPFYSKVFMACERSADELGYTMLLANSLNQVDQELKRLEQLAERTDAIIVLGGSVDHRMVSPRFSKKLIEIADKMPIVTGGSLQAGKQCYSVQIDEAQAMELVLEHLLSLGHRSIAQVGGSSQIISTWAKTEQFNRIFARNEMTPDPTLCLEEAGYDSETGYRQTNALLDDGHRPTAIIAINDAVALGVLKSLREHGLRIPEDVSVAGYDNTFLSTVAVPMLTTVDYDYDLLGEKLVQTAISAIHGAQTQRTQIIQPSLVVRDSTGPAKQD
jgi:DNA-binding LacI/PurR family transcriptional regulator